MLQNVAETLVKSPDKSFGLMIALVHLFVLMSNLITLTLVGAFLFSCERSSVLLYIYGISVRFFCKVLFINDFSILFIEILNNLLICLLF
jgi:hypothetical protein